MPKYEILSNEKLFDSWNELRHDVEQFIDHGRSIVQNDTILSNYDITEYLFVSERLAIVLKRKILDLQDTTRDYLKGRMGCGNTNI